VTVEHRANVYRPWADTLATVKTFAAVLATMFNKIFALLSLLGVGLHFTQAKLIAYDIGMVYWEENAFIYQYSKENSVDTILTNSVSIPIYSDPCILNSIKVKVINIKRVLCSEYAAEKVLVLWYLQNSLSIQ
jgi:hypothetical protein